MLSRHVIDASAHPSPPPWWGRISLLWLMCVPVMVAMYSLCIGIVPHDFWWHARVGGIIASTGRVPTTNIFSSSLPPDAPYVYQSWLAELIFYEILRWGGLAWIVMARSLCVTVAFALMVAASYRRALAVAQDALAEIAASRGLQSETTNLYLSALATPLARLTALGALIALVLAAPSMEVRPQIFSVPLFALFIAALLEWPRWVGCASATPSVPAKARALRLPRSLWRALVPLTGAMLLWANLHGAFCTGLIVIGVFLCGEALYAWWPLAPQRKVTWGTPLPTPALCGLAFLLLLCTLAALINPRGVGIFFYVLRLAGDPPSQKYIGEWQSPTWGNAIHDVFFLSILLLVLLARQLNSASLDSNPTPNGAARYGRYGIRAGELLVLAALAVMTGRNVRSLVWYALLYAPLCSACGTAALVKLRARQWFARNAPLPILPVPSRSLTIVNAGMAGFLLLLIVPELPWVKPYLPLPLTLRERFAPNPAGQFPLGFAGDPPLLLDRLNPVEAVAYLRHHPPRHRLFTDMGYGSYVIWMLYPAQRPAADTRVELYPLPFWDEYFRLSNGPPDAARRLTEQGFSDALLNAGPQAGLIKRLQAAPDWHVVWSQGHAVLLRHKN